MCPSTPNNQPKGALLYPLSNETAGDLHKGIWVNGLLCFIMISSTHWLYSAASRLSQWFGDSFKESLIQIVLACECEDEKYYVDYVNLSATSMG